MALELTSNHLGEPVNQITNNTRCDWHVCMNMNIFWSPLYKRPSFLEFAERGTWWQNIIIKFISIVRSHFALDSIVTSQCPSSTNKRGLSCYWGKSYFKARISNHIPLVPVGVIVRSKIQGGQLILLDKMAAFSQTFSTAFSWMKMLELRFNFHWKLFLMVQWTINQHWFR